MEQQEDGAQEAVVFVKEMLKLKPSRQMLKIYAIGSTLALLGAVAGLMEKVTFNKERITGQKIQKRQETLRTDSEELSTVLEETRWIDHRRSSANRVHAS